MKSPSQHVTESPPKQETVDKLSPIRRRLPSATLFVGSCIFAAFVIIVLLASLVSNQAEGLFKVWIDRMTF